MTLDAFVPVLDLAVKGSALLLTGLVVTRLMRRASAASRHAVLAAVCAAVLVLPLVRVMTPEWGVSWMPSWLTSSPGTPAVASATLTSAATVADTPSPSSGPAWAWVNAGQLVLMVWALGTMALLVRLALAHRRMRTFQAMTRPAGSVRLLQRFETVAAWSGRPDVELREAPSGWMPVTWGLRQVTVALPVDAATWPQARVDAVLVHELAHVSRRDAWWQMLAEVTVACWWWHPLVWMIAASLRSERERACDDQVLAFGTRPTDYASDLVELVSDSGGEAMPREAVLAMARRSNVEGRVMAILNPGVNRRGRTVAATVLAATIGGGSWALAAMRPVEPAPVAPAVTQETQQPLRVGSGILEPRKLKNVHPVYPADAIAQRVQGVVIIEARIDADGTVSGARILRSAGILDQAALDAVRQWQFTPTLLNGQPVPVIISTTVSFRLGADGQPVPPPPPPPPPVPVKDPHAPPQPPPPPPPPPAPPSDDDPLRVGGNIKEPKKVKHVAPIYPPEAQEARIQGIVILEVLIDPDGKVTSARVIRGVNGLDDAAVDAVLQWEFTPTLFNGIARPVIMTVTVNFTLQ